jgi:hypothetical protein
LAPQATPRTPIAFDKIAPPIFSAFTAACRCRCAGSFDAIVIVAARAVQVHVSWRATMALRTRMGHQPTRGRITTSGEINGGPK